MARRRSRARNEGTRSGGGFTWFVLRWSSIFTRYYSNRTARGRRDAALASAFPSLPYFSAPTMRPREEPSCPGLDAIQPAQLLQHEKGDDRVPAAAHVIHRKASIERSRALGRRDLRDGLQRARLRQLARRVGLLERHAVLGGLRGGGARGARASRSRQRAVRNPLERRALRARARARTSNGIVHTAYT